MFGNAAETFLWSTSRYPHQDFVTFVKNCLAMLLNSTNISVINLFIKIPPRDSVRRVQIKVWSEMWPCSWFIMECINHILNSTNISVINICTMNVHQDFVQCYMCQKVLASQAALYTHLKLTHKDKLKGKELKIKCDAVPTKWLSGTRVNKYLSPSNMYCVSGPALSYVCCISFPYVCISQILVSPKGYTPLGPSISCTFGRQNLWPKPLHAEIFFGHVTIS